MIAIATVGMLALLTLSTGLLLAFTPYLMRRNECFATTVPAAAQNDPRLRALKKRYAAFMIALTVVCTIASLGAGALIISGNDAAGVAIECSSVAVLAIASFALMLAGRRKVIAIKHAEGWQAQHKQTVAVAAEEDLPGALPLAWNLLYIPVILATAGIGFVLYPSMPDMLPMHADFAGNVTNYTSKSIGSAIGFPVLFEVFMAACLTFSHWTILRSKRAVDPSAPAASALAYGLFARAQSVFLLVVGIVCGGGIGMLFLLSSAGFITLGQAGAIVLLLTVPVVGGSIALSVVYGQAGSRVFLRLQGEDELLADDDEHWKLGIIYFNRDDASLFLPERFGIGWTINFARPAAWAIVAGFIVITLAFVFVTISLAS
ncbi:MAG: DUF5808 domain-containing protein [Slackia sp.]|nr:DUF5808 domain-containing protein [Slackia sp.]